MEELGGYESVRLFADRASNKHPGFELTPENARAVAQVCVRLEGIPLAVELAAARIGILSAEQISERLGHSLKLLKSEDRTADHRHQTLRAALEWSFDLLGEPEQILFRKLSAFAGGFTLDAAESVGGRVGIDEEDVSELLSHLVDKSLVVAQENWETGARYRPLEPIRQYAREILRASGEAEAVGRRHTSSSSHWQRRPSQSCPDRSRPSGWIVWRLSMTTSGPRSLGRSGGRSTRDFGWLLPCAGSGTRAVI